jgi:O-6-methylguanine DNA methyltransferase
MFKLNMIFWLLFIVIGFAVLVAAVLSVSYLWILLAIVVVMIGIGKLEQDFIKKKMEREQKIFLIKLNLTFWVLFTALGFVVLATALINFNYLQILLAIAIIMIGIGKLEQDFIKKRTEREQKNINNELFQINQGLEHSYTTSSKLKDRIDYRIYHLDKKRVDIEKKMELNQRSLAAKIIDLENKITDLKTVVSILAKKQGVKRNFEESVLEIVKRIPSGMVTTYSDVARALGRPRAARAVGVALRKNPHPDKIPCFRVVRKNGDVGGFSLGVMEKIRRLREDGIEVRK